MEVKKWFFRTFLADALLKRAYRAADAFLTKKYPQGWPRVQFAMSGWVTKLGVLLTVTSSATLLAVDQLNQGGHPEEAVWLGVKAGIFLVAVGLGRKGLKWVLYEEAIDGDGWLDDPDAKKPEGLDENEKALLQGKLADIKEDLTSAKVGVSEAQSFVDRATPGREGKKLTGGKL